MYMGLSCETACNTVSSQYFSEKISGNRCQIVVSLPVSGSYLIIHMLWPNIKRISFEFAGSMETMKYLHKYPVKGFKNDIGKVKGRVGGGGGAFMTRNGRNSRLRTLSSG